MHIENVSTYHKHVQVEAEHYAEAAARHPALARRVRATIGWDFRSFDAEMRDAEILVFMGLDFKPGNFRKRAPKLRWIQLTSAGIDHVSPLDWLPRGVVMTNNSGVHAEKHGEFGLTALLMLNHNVPIMTTNQRRARWHTVFGSPIRGKTVAIVGVGRIGGRAAELCKAMGMTVLGVRRGGGAHPHVDEMFRPAQVRKAMARADFVLVTLPLTGATRHFVGRRELEAMKPGAGFANLGRGATVDYDALRALLESGRLSGAVLDAFEEEPLPASSPLWRTRNLIISPHCSSSDVDRYVPDTLDLTFDNLGRYMRGQPLRNAVDLRLGY